MQKSKKDCQKTALQIVLLGLEDLMPRMPATGWTDMSGSSATNWRQSGGKWGSGLWCQQLGRMGDLSTSYWSGRWSLLTVPAGGNGVCPENQLLGGLVWVRQVKGLMPMARDCCWRWASICICPKMVCVEVYMTHYLVSFMLDHPGSRRSLIKQWLSGQRVCADILGKPECGVPMRQVCVHLLAVEHQAELAE